MFGLFGRILSYVLGQGIHGWILNPGESGMFVLCKDLKNHINLSISTKQLVRASPLDVSSKPGVTYSLKEPSPLILWKTGLISDNFLGYSPVKDTSRFEAVCKEAKLELGHLHLAMTARQMQAATDWGSGWNATVGPRTPGESKDLVEKGYNQIALRYLEWSSTSTIRVKYVQKLLQRLPEQAEVLELGCGVGVPSPIISVTLSRTFCSWKFSVR
jgi:hypothetical protein